VPSVKSDSGTSTDAVEPLGREAVTKSREAEPSLGTMRNSACGFMPDGAVSTALKVMLPAPM